MTDDEIRHKAINTIETLYPPDWEGNPLGQELLEQARRDCNNWRNEPTPILVRLAQLCRDREERQTREFFSKHKSY